MHGIIEFLGLALVSTFAINLTVQLFLRSQKLLVSLAVATIPAFFVFLGPAPMPLSFYAWPLGAGLIGSFLGLAIAASVRVVAQRLKR